VVSLQIANYLAIELPSGILIYSSAASSLEYDLPASRGPRGVESTRRNIRFKNNLCIVIFFVISFVFVIPCVIPIPIFSVYRYQDPFRVCTSEEEAVDDCEGESTVRI